MKLLTRLEAAEFLRISLRKLDQLAADGEIPYTKIGPGKTARVLYRKDVLEEYIERQTVDIRAKVSSLARSKYL